MNPPSSEDFDSAHGASTGEPVAAAGDATAVIGGAKSVVSGADAAVAKATQRDLQRQSLGALVELCQSCRDQEEQLAQRQEEGEHTLLRRDQQAAEAEKSQYDQARQSIEARVANEREQAESLCAAQLAEAKKKASSVKSLADHARAGAEATVKENFQQAAWLADSLLEGTQNQLRAQARQQTEIHAQRLESLAGLSAAMDATLLRYNFHLLPGAVDGGSQSPQEFDAHFQQAQALLGKLNHLGVPRLLVGALPYLGLLVLCVVGVAIGQAIAATLEPNSAAIGLGALGGLLVGLAGGLVLRWMGRKQIAAALLPLHQQLTAAERASQREMDRLHAQRESENRQARQTRDAEVKQLKEKAAPVLRQTAEKHEAALAAAREQLSQAEQLGQGQRQRHLGELDQTIAADLRELDQKHARDVAQRQEALARSRREQAERLAADRAALVERWSGGLAEIQSPIRNHPDEAPLRWDDGAWESWTPPGSFAAAVRFGQLAVNVRDITQRVPQTLPLPESFSVPALLAFPRQASLLIQSDRGGRVAGLDLLRALMLRLLTSLPAGRARFTLVDPVGLGQSFAGFMHLSDFDEAMVGGRIWTDSEQIEQRLADLTEHMETVIQKYLRNEFETIDDYNAQAGELAEPYRFLVIADFPVNFSADAFARLASIVTSGSRCGVYTLVLRDLRQSAPPRHCLEELEARSVNLLWKADRFIWKDPVFEKFPLQLDEAPSETTLTRLLQRVGHFAKDAKRVEVPFESIAPDDSQHWSLDCTRELSVPIGRMGANRRQLLRLGRGVAQHVLIAGKTGSGKSTLLHALITNLALWYSPEQVELYLIDFKKGVEFKSYATGGLPHARAIAVESDREFGLSVLQRLDGELTRRGQLYRALGVQDLAAYRQAKPDSPMPRTLLIIDEFQEFFSEDDRVAQEATLLLDRLVRQGRAFGIHVLLGSQTIGGTSGLARSTLGQMAVRVALQCSEADSQLILGDNNYAARLLSRPGEAIYNDAGGLVESNSPFQVAWLSDERRDAYLAEVEQLANQKKVQTEAPIVFEGNASADISKNRELATFMSATTWSQTPVLRAFLGDPVAIKAPTSVAFRRQSGANLLIVGQQETEAMALHTAAIISLALQSQQASFIILDGTAADSPLIDTFSRLSEKFPGRLTLVEYRGVEEAMGRLAEELEKRRQSSEPLPPVFVIIQGLHRYRALRKREDSFSFSPSDAPPAPPPADKVFAELLREGPELGMHALCWCDTLASLERTMDRSSLREMDHRVLFQMSASDSSNLIDSPLGNKLGFHRALAYSEEQGTVEKFRPYGPPAWDWIALNR